MSSFLYLVFYSAFLGFASAAEPENFLPYLQPNDDLDAKTFLNASADSTNCSRVCTADGVPKICYYKWVVANYVTLGYACGNCLTNATDCFNHECIPADGVERGLIAVNRRLPGPSIEVCLGDRVVIDVVNELAGRSLAIHWHGVFQRGSQYMDGVPMLTQCAILEGDTFRYDFYADNEGTHYWHSHDGLQSLDGIQGSLVVRTPLDANILMSDYDLPEHKIMIQDWFDDSAENHFPGLLGVNKGQVPNSFLINGLGNAVVDNVRTTTPYHHIYVEYGWRHRMRIIGGLGTTCPVQFSIEGHHVFVIAVDGNSVSPKIVTDLVIYSGERYDIVVNAFLAAEGSYWIHIKGLSSCSPHEVYQLGVLTYVDDITSYTANNSIPATAPPGYDGFMVSNPRIMNPENGTCNGTGVHNICPTQLLNLEPVPSDIMSKTADVNLLLNYGEEDFDPDTFYDTYQRYYVVNGERLVSHTMNNISFVSPPVPPLSQPTDVPSEVLCPVGSDGLPQCPEGASYCACTHIIKIPLGSLVQIMLNDQNPGGGINHPFHMHGYTFYLMNEGQYADGQTVEDVYNNVTSNVYAMSPYPPQKDTIAVPSNGYAVIKFKADNPGYWIFHCHFTYHLATGMAVVFQIGERSDFPDIPDGFPTCGSYFH